MRMVARYDIRTDPTGWTVHDIAIGAPATVEGKKLVGLRLDDADDLADLLSHRDAALAKLRRLITARDRRQRFRVIDGGKF